MTEILLGAGLFANDVEGGLFSTAGAAAPAAGGSRGDRDGRSGADSPLFFELFHQVSNLKNSERAELIPTRFCVSAMIFFLFGIVAPRSLRAFEAGSRQPDKEPFLFAARGAASKAEGNLSW